MLDPVGIYAGDVRLVVRADADEAAPTVAVDGNGAGDYAVRKRRAELAVLEHFPHTHVVLRPGVVLGPRENLGRVAWWRAVMRDPGGRVLPGPRTSQCRSSMFAI